MAIFYFSVITIGIMIISLLYCIFLALGGKKKNAKMLLPIFAFIIGLIESSISIYSSMDFSDIAQFDFSKTTSVNSIIHAYPTSPFTIRYTLDGTLPSKNGLLYTQNGITVRKEDTQDDSFVIYYQIGINDSFYFSKVYTQEYQVGSMIKLYSKKLSSPPEEKWVDIDEKLVFSKLTVDNKKGSFDLIDGNVNTKQKFQHSIIKYHTIVFSESNKKDFSKIYLFQKGISRIDISVDDQFDYFCEFDAPDIKTSGLFEINFSENVSVNSNIKFKIYSSQNDYSISDIWFDYYITQ